MTSFVNWLMTGLTPLLLTARAGDAPVSRGLAARVAARIADAWRVPVEQVRLSWGRSSGIASPTDETTFRVLGRGEDGWFVVVFDPAASAAMAVRVRAGIERPVMVASRSLPAGSRIGDGDLREEMRVRWGVPSTDSLAAPAPGWEVRRPLNAGEVVAAPAVAAPPLVFAGQPVRMEWQRGGVEVSVMGIALNNARRGETVRARLEERPARLTGTVVAPGTAVLAAGGRGR
jgi:flagella basal body P-ring formation protein FlgA